MERLIELSQIVTKNRLKKVDMLSHSSIKERNKYLNASDLLAKQQNTSPKEVAKIIGTDEKSNKFHVFKLRLFDKLLNSLLFLDLDKRATHPYEKAVADCNRNSYCVILLLILNARQSAAFIAEKSLKKAMKFELADVALFCVRHLRTHYSLLGDKENFEYYNGLVKYYHEVLIAEDSASEYLESIYNIEANSNTLKNKNISTACDLLSKITLLIKTYPTYQIGLNYYRIKGIASFLKRDYESALNTWEEFDALIKKYEHFEYHVRRGESELNKMDCYLHLRDFKNGTICAQKCDKLFKLYSNNWYIFKEFHLLLAFHTANYYEATEIINQVIESSHFKQLRTNLQEKWKIFEAYLYILWKYGKIKEVDINKKTVQFRLGKFINNIPTFTKDKKGYNVLILVIQFLYFLIEKNYSAITDKIDALDRYAYRYFTEETDSRARTFLTMIMQVEKSGFSLDKTQQKTTKLYSKLKEMQIAHVAGLEGLEIVPFVDLWKLVLGVLS